MRREVKWSSLVGTASLTSTSTGTTYHTCTSGAIVAKTSNTGGSAQSVSASTLDTFGGCSSTVDPIKGGSLQFHWISGGDNAIVTSSETEVTTNVFGSCIFGTGAGTTLGTYIGSSTTPVLTVHAVMKRLNACFGPAEAEFNATYHTTKPIPLYFSAS